MRKQIVVIFVVTITIIMIFGIAGSGCIQNKSAQVEKSHIVTSQPSTGEKTSQYRSSPEATGILTVPEYIELPNIGDTFQIIPETIDITQPVFSYKSGCPSEVSVSDEGLITVMGMGIVTVYVICQEEISDNGYVSEILVVAGPIVVGKDYYSGH